MDSKFVLRVMTEAGEMLGWQEVMAHARGDGAMWLEYEVCIPIDVDGRAARISAHWADVNVEVMVAVFPQNLVRGSSVTIAPGELVRVGPCAGGLPPVTTRHNVEIGVPVGALSAVGSR